MAAGYEYAAQPTYYYVGVAQVLGGSRPLLKETRSNLSLLIESTATLTSILGSPA